MGWNFCPSLPPWLLKGGSEWGKLHHADPAVVQALPLAVAASHFYVQHQLLL